MKTMSDMPLISIIIAAYNVEKYIGQCLDSIIGQTYPNLQIIIVDDGSTDDSGRIADEYSKSDQRIEVFHKQNGGLVSARKEGLKYAKGGYVSFVDGDDYVDVKMYDVLRRYMENNCVDFVHSGYLEKSENGGATKRFPNATDIVSLGDENAVNSYIQKYVFNDCDEPGITFSIWSKMFRTEIANCYNEIPDDASYGEDLLFLIICLYRCNAFMIVDEALYNYRIVTGSLSRNNPKQRLLKEITLEYHLKQILERNTRNVSFHDAAYDYYRRRMSLAIWKASEDDSIRRFEIENLKCLEGRKVVLFGAGAVGRDYYIQLRMNSSVYLTSWMDSNAFATQIFDRGIERPEDIMSKDYDHIILASDSITVRNEMKNQLLSLGVPENSIINTKPCHLF